MQKLFDYILSVFSFNPNSPLLFTQFHFWAFFALVFAGFALAKKRRLLRNSYLFFVSLLFYYKTSGLFVGLLILVTCTDFFIAQAIHKNNVQWKRKALLALSVTIDLGILCYFKYAYFFADMVHSIFGFQMTVTNVAASAGNSILGSNFFNVDKIILPVGISFYTFQVISYTADVYKGLVKPVRNILDFGFYVSFFPQLVAGPIIKASDFIPQLYKKYNISHRMFGLAVFWILNGLIKKIILSDYLAYNFIDRVFENPHLFSGFENLMSLFTYSLQVYADFSGYTDIAIGLSLLMGFHLPKNFNSPYKALNCSNFWKRWHISLSRWLQTYLYIPLGGNRNITFGTYFWISIITLAALVLSGSWWIALGVLLLALLVIFKAYKHPEKRKKIYANLNAMITMLLGGLWHGASMNFVIWGGLNGVGMVVYKFWRDNSALWRVVTSLIVVVVLLVLIWFTPIALWNVLLVCAIFIAVSAIIRWLYNKYNTRERNLKWLANSWAIFVTFVFISFTRLFFRSGSNLQDNPAAANEIAWDTAKSMVQQIGTSWNVNILDVIGAYHNVFLLFVIGMIIHWIPEKMKRKYRYTFASLPLPAIGALAVIAIFFVFQFVSAEMQPFIYFQF